MSKDFLIQSYSLVKEKFNVCKLFNNRKKLTVITNLYHRKWREKKSIKVGAGK
jgi:hypothetical protein